MKARKSLSFLLIMVLLIGMIPPVYAGEAFEHTLAAGSNFVYILKKDGTLWGSGDSTFGVLGKKFDGARFSFSDGYVKIMTNVKSVSVGNTACFIIKNDNTLWSIGDGSSGKLGGGDKTRTFIFKPIKVMSNVKMAVMGSDHALVVKHDGTLWAFGSNDFGQLGIGTSEGYKTKPVKIMDHVLFASAGGGTSFAVMDDYSLWGFGRNEEGELGIGSTTSHNKPIKIMDDVINVTTDNAYTFVIKSDGTLYGFGRNENGTLGDGTQQMQTSPVKIMDNVKDVAITQINSLFLKKDGTLFICGSNFDQSTGTDSKELYVTTPLKLMNDVVAMDGNGNDFFILNKKGVLYGFGLNQVGYFYSGKKDIYNNPIPMNKKREVGSISKPVPIQKDIKMPQLDFSVK